MEEVLNVKEWLKGDKQFEFSDYSEDVVIRLKDGKEFRVFELVSIYNGKHNLYIDKFYSDKIHVNFSASINVPINDIEKFVITDRSDVVNKFYGQDLP